MSFYSEASLAYVASAGAGKDGKAYSMKPVPEYGAELVTNGDFATDSDWNKGGGWTISGGTANCAGTGTSILRQTNAVPFNTKFYFSLEVKNYVSGVLEVKFAPIQQNLNVTGNGIYTIYTNGDNSVNQDIQILSSNFIGSIDNVSVKEVLVADGDFTFSRGSNLAATRVGPTGLIEKGRENLLLQSNQFDTTWAKSGTTLTSGQAGYDGSNDAWLLTKTGASFNHLNQSISQSGVKAFSVYAKAGTLNGLRLLNLGGGNSTAYFDLSNGTLVSKAAATIEAKIEAVGNGWYRCSITDNEAITQVRIYPITPPAVFSDNGSIYIQDAQLEIGLAATEVISTGATTGKAGLLEDEPRFDYSGGATCPSLLLEPSMTQLVTQSEYFNSSDWISSSNVTITDNVTTSPEGVQNASLINFTSSGNYFQHNGPAIVSGATYTISCYVKRAISTDQVFKIYGNNNKASANLTATSEWQRFTHTFTADSTNFASGLSAPSTAQIHLYGFQVEQGSYPTSYIPNHSGGTITRGAETPSNLSATSVIGQTEGTLFIDFLYESTASGNRFSISDGTATNWVFIGTPESGTSSRFYIRVNSSVIVDVGASSYFVNGQQYKLALAYKSGDWAAYGNGIQLYSGTNTIPSFSSPMDTINFKSYNPSDVITEREKVNQVLFFDTRLSNADLATLTTI